MASTNVEDNLNSIIGAGSPVLDQARTGASQASNARGLLNSSINAQAGESAVIGAAEPMAAQDASQANQSQINAADLSSQQQIAAENIASNNSQQTAAAVSAFGNAYDTGLNAIASNPNIPADARNGYLNNIAQVRNQDMSLLQQIYGININAGGTPGGF